MREIKDGREGRERSRMVCWGKVNNQRGPRLIDHAWESARNSELCLPAVFSVLFSVRYLPWAVHITVGNGQNKLTKQIQRTDGPNGLIVGLVRGGGTSNFCCGINVCSTPIRTLIASSNKSSLEHIQLVVTRLLTLCQLPSVYAILEYGIPSL